MDGKLLCWLCTLSFKRALAKTKQTDADRRAHMKLTQLHKNKHKEGKYVNFYKFSEMGFCT